MAVNEQPQHPRAATPKPKTVATDALKANPHNPRLLFDEVDLRTLTASIQKVGILVPITVYKAAGSDRFTILDGQRRWICATRLNLPTVPINEIQEPTLVQNIVTMFQIHKLREDWELMPTALKLEVLMQELKERRDPVLAELTGLDAAVVGRCKKLLTFSSKYQNMMLRKDPDSRVRADFFIELYPVLMDREVVKASWYNKSKMIESFLNKYENKLSGFKAITDFRKIKSYLSAAKNSNQTNLILRKFERFISDGDMPLTSLEIDSARVAKEAGAIAKSVTKLSSTISSIDVDEFAAEEEMWEALEDLLKTIKSTFASAERRLPK